MEFEWNIFPGVTTFQLAQEVPKFMNKVGEPNETPENFKGRIIFMSMLMTSYGEQKTLKRNVLPIHHLCPYSQKDFQQDVGHFSDLGQKQSGIPLTKKDHKGERDRVAELMMIKFRESGHPVFRATSPLSRGTLKAKEVENYLTLMCRW